MSEENKDNNNKEKSKKPLTISTVADRVRQEGLKEAEKKLDAAARTYLAAQKTADAALEVAEELQADVLELAPKPPVKDAKKHGDKPTN